jgi:hypothetical protein
LNGASIGTETITLTDPNTSFTFPEVGTFIYFDEATWGTNFRLKLLYADVSGYDQYAYYRHDPQTTYVANGIQVERSTGIWTDWGNEAPNTVNNDTPTSGKIQFENQYNQVYTFTNPYPTSTSTPTFIPVQLDETGDLDLGRSYRHVSTSGTLHTFQLYNGDVADNAGVETYITYDTSDKKWRDAGTDHPNTFAVSSSSSFTTSGHSDPSVATGTDNAEYIHLVRNNGYQQLLTFQMAGWSSTSTFTNFPSTIAFTGWWNDQFNRHYQLTTSTDTFIQYELYDANGLVGAEYGSTFTSTPSGILFNVEDVGDSSTPFSYSNGSTFVGTSGIVQAGDSLTLWTNTTGTGTAEAVFTVPDFFYEAPPGVPIVQSIACTPQGNAVLLDGDYTTSYITYRFNSSDESITYTNGVGWEDLGSNRPFTISSPTGENIDLGMGWGTITLPNPYFVNGVEVGYEAIEPQTITPTTVNNSWTGATYVWKETVGTSEIYTLAFNGVATNNNHEIQVDTITNTWSDYGTNNPNTVTDNGSTVTLSSGTTTFVVFNKPTSASWL